jgi:hypothetical protein
LFGEARLAWEALEAGTLVVSELLATSLLQRCAVDPEVFICIYIYIYCWLHPYCRDIAVNPEVCVYIHINIYIGHHRAYGNPCIIG